jgi:hypothetical protein
VNVQDADVVDKCLDYLLHYRSKKLNSSGVEGQTGLTNAASRLEPLRYLHTPQQNRTETLKGQLRNRHERCERF